MSTSSLLPNELRFEFSKLVDYLLNSNHKDGGAKAKFFLGHGFPPDDPFPLAEALALHAREGQPSKVVPTIYGRKIVFERALNTPNGMTTRVVRSVWEHRTNETFARLLPAYPL